jgi:hypothetical protein
MAPIGTKKFPEKESKKRLLLNVQPVIFQSAIVKPSKQMKG